MSTMKTLGRTEAKLATARGLLQIVHFIYDHAEGSDWQEIKTPFGFLLNALSAELGDADRAVDRLYAEHFTANDQGRSH